jgi:DNA polymerase-3 subunit delta'
VAVVPAPLPARPWPPALVGTPTIAVLERAIARGRLAHSLLLHGDSLETLAAVADAITDRLLAAPAAAGGSHPDCFVLRPAGKMRQIGADATRALVDQVQVTAGFGERKVAVIHEADRMNSSAANIFLKTLEEPPANTTLLLLTTHPYALLGTIRSRCLHFRFPSDLAADPAPAEGWAAWLADYRGWLERLAAGTADPRAAADHVFSAYGLVARFGSVLDRAAAAAWETQRANLPADLEDDEQVAIETGIFKGLRSRCFAEIEAATRAYARVRLLAGEDSVRRPFAAAVEELERVSGLMQVNLNESAALESFLLSSLRLWSRRSLPG